MDLEKRYKKEYQYLVAKIGFDTAESEPPNIWQIRDINIFLQISNLPTQIHIESSKGTLLNVDIFFVQLAETSTTICSLFCA